MTGLLGALAREPGVGFAAPRSNWASQDQIIARPGDTDAPSDDLDRFAAERHRVHAATGREATRLNGLRMAITRDALGRIVGFGIRFEIGNPEDGGHSIRARLAGIRLWIADDSHVHHFGHKTCDLVGEDDDDLLRTTALRDALRWDLPPDGDHRGLVPDRAFDPSRDAVSLPG